MNLAPGDFCRRASLQLTQGIKCLPPVTIDMHDSHECTRFDQLNTCIECGEPKHPVPDARFSGGAGARRQPLSDEDYSRQIRKIQEKAARNGGSR